MTRRRRAAQVQQFVSTATFNTLRRTLFRIATAFGKARKQETCYRLDAVHSSIIRELKVRARNPLGIPPRTTTHN
jgi:hypothetical protein